MKIFSSLWRVLLLSCAVLAFVPGTAVAQSQGSTIEAIKKRGSLRVGWAVVYPHMYRDPKTNQLTGISYEIAQEMAKSLGVKLELVEDNWATLVAGVQSNKFDITIASLAITLPRAMAVTYTRPSHQSAVGLMIRKSDADKFKSWKDMDKPGVRISVTLGSNADMFASRVFEKAEIIRVKAAPDSIAQLLTNKAEAWGSPVDSFIKAGQEQPALVTLQGPPIGYSKVSMAVKPGDYFFRDWVNHFLDELQDTGALLRIFQKYNLGEDSLIK
jgi:ABC-type amino acid transport substrate-binding protein